MNAPHSIEISYTNDDDDGDGLFYGSPRAHDDDDDDSCRLTKIESTQL